MATLCAGAPYALIVISSRRQLLSGRHVPSLRERPAVLGGSALSAVVGLAAASWLEAGRELSAVVVATVVGLVVAAVISTRWKLSIHMACAAGALCAITIVTSVWVLLAVPIVATLGWSRIRIAAHDLGQVLAGSIIGLSITGVVISQFG